MLVALFGLGGIKCLMLLGEEGHKNDRTLKIMAFMFLGMAFLLSL